MHVDRQLPAVSKPSPLCMACSALAVRGVQRWPSVPHTWWGCAGACNAWRGTGIQCVERDRVPLGCCGVGVRAAAKAHSSESSESEGCAARPPTAAAAALLGLDRLPARDGGRGLLTTYLPASARAGPLGPACDVTRHVPRLCAALHVRAACTRCMYALHVCARGRGESAIAHRLPCSS